MELSVVYGSQTGTAEEVAHGISRDGFRHHFIVTTKVLDSINLNILLDNKPVIFVCSTTGQGDPPDNMVKFWKFIMRRNLPTNSLEKLQFAVVGLGDSSYSKYNYIGKKLYRRLIQLSATPLLPLIMCDDQHDLGHDAALDKNLPDLWKNLISIYPIPANKSIISKSVLLPSKYKITLDNPAGESTDHSEVVFSCPVMNNTRLTSDDHFQDVRLISFDIKHTDIRYKPGDVVYIQPSNLADVVEEFFNVFNSLGADTPFHVQSSQSGDKIPPRLTGVLTWRKLVTTYLDLNAPPKRYFYELLSHFSKDELEREKLLEFSSPEGQDERFTYADRVRRTPLEILSDFKHTTPYIPESYILDLFSPLRPRAFSIASSQQKTRDQIDILMAIVEYKTKLQKPRRGVCTSWLSQIKPHTELVPLYTRPGSFKLPEHGQTCILIGPGTGVAPFRSFITERVLQNCNSNTLYFGCRYQHKDFICHQEWEELVKNSQLKLFTAFSRDQEEKCYVWDVMRNTSKQIWKLLNEDNAFIFVAGNAKRMPDDVRATFVKIVQSEGLKSEEEAELYVKTLESSNKYQIECWS